MDIKTLSRFMPTFKLPPKPKLTRRAIITAVLLMLIVATAFWLRSLPARFGELQAIDPFYLYRMSEYVLENNWQMPEVDLMRHNPFGANPIASDPPVLYYLPAIMYVAMGGLGMSYLEFAILFPAIMGAIAVFLVFFLGREIFDTRAGLFASFFLAVIPAFITRTSAGFFEKEGLGGVFMIMTVYFFVVAYKRGSLKHGILSGISIMLMFQSWGGAQYMYLLFGAFTFLLLLLNRYDDKILKAYAPFTVLGVAAILIFPYHLDMTYYPAAISTVVLGVLLVRALIGKYELVKKEQLMYVTPAVAAVGLVIFLISTMFTDVTYNIIVSLSNLFFMQKGVAAATVAEQMPGTWADVSSSLGVLYSNSMVGWLSPVSWIFAASFMMVIGVAFLIYMFYHNGFKNRTIDWIHVLLIFWLFSSIFSVFNMVRLLFLLGVPAALLAGYGMSEISGRSRWVSSIRKNDEAFRKAMFIVPAAVLISLLLIVNVSNAYVYSNSLGPSFGSYWEEAMDFLEKETPENSNILSWWDFGYWFQTRGNRPSVSDGGGAGPRFNLALWFMNDARNWGDYTCNFENLANISCEGWLKDRYHVDYILMDYTLPAKYGAISKIGSNDKAVVGILQFEQTGMYPQGNKTIYEFRAGQYSIWLPFDGQSLSGTPMFLISEGDQYVSRAYINDICTTSGITTVGAETPSLGGCVAITNFGVFYVPEEAKNNVFTNLMFMDGYGLPVSKVFDNGAVHIYEVLYDSEGGQ